MEKSYLPKPTWRRFIKRGVIIILYGLLIITCAYLLPAESHKYLFVIYALSIFLILMIISGHNPQGAGEKEKNNYKKIFLLVLILSILFLIITRLMPFIRFGEAPLGYDTGFYLWRFSATNALEKPFYLSFLPYYFLGLSPLAALNVFYVISQLLLAGSLYVLMRTLKIASGFYLAVLTIFLFCVSITQFQAYWWMFCQQMLAMGLMLITISLILRRSVVAVLTASLGIIIHPPTFIMLSLVAAIAFSIYLFKQYRQRKTFNLKLLYIVGGGLGVIGLIVIFKFQDFLNYFNLYILTYHGLSSNFPFWDVPKMKGLFVSPLFYNLSTLLIVPFAAFSFLNPRVWLVGAAVKKDDQTMRNFLFIIYTMVIGLFFLVVLPVIYQHRFIIIFDIFLIILAAPALLLLIKKFFQDKIGKLLVLVFLGILILRSGLFVWAQQPQLYPDELQELKSIATVVDPKLLLIATNTTYTPWVIGFSGHESFGPGYGADLWTFSDWQTFWSSENDDDRYTLLAKYPNNSIYLFIGNRENTNLPYQKNIRTDSSFTLVSPHIWRYSPKQNNYDQE